MIISDSKFLRTYSHVYLGLHTTIPKFICDIIESITTLSRNGNLQTYEYEFLSSLESVKTLVSTIVDFVNTDEGISKIKSECPQVAGVSDTQLRNFLLGYLSPILSFSTIPELIQHCFTSFSTLQHLLHKGESFHGHEFFNRLVSQDQDTRAFGPRNYFVVEPDVVAYNGSLKFSEKALLISVLFFDQARVEFDVGNRTISRPVGLSSGSILIHFNTSSSTRVFELLSALVTSLTQSVRIAENFLVTIHDSSFEEDAGKRQRKANKNITLSSSSRGYCT